MAITVSPRRSPHSAKPLLDVRIGDDAAPLIPCRDQAEEGRGGVTVVGPDAELVDDEDLGSGVYPHTPVVKGGEKVGPLRRSKSVPLA